ncbi:MAG: PQQ-binding-like beta-propeller repeat protein [Acidobacteria bacterium]|nr:PQQ-binding-like beta-propeller repeat protein [Acidobacteriota bacterium]
MAKHSSGEPGGAPPVVMVESTGEARKYWPRWRGPSGQGLVEGGGYVDTWSDQENVLWKVAVPGSGNSSPIIWGDRIFLTTAYDGGERRSILCLRRSDGKLLWETFAPAASPERAYWKNGYASGTPTTDGERVYVYFGNHGLLSVDFNGKQVWHHSFGPVNPLHGTACSPLLYRDKIIVFQDHRGPGASFVAAFDKRTGNPLWRTEREERVGWGSAVAIRAGDREEIIVSSYKRVYAYHPETGSELWRCAGNLVEVTPTPVVGHGLLFCSSGRAGPTLAIRPGGSGDVTATHIAWRTSKGSPFVPSPLLYGDYLYLVNDMMSIGTCYEARTGRLMWQARLGEARREGFSASPVGVDGKVFFTNDEGETFVLKAGTEFKLLRINRLNARTLASPALVDGKWYFRTEGHLYCIGERRL